MYAFDHRVVDRELNSNSAHFRDVCLIKRWLVSLFTDERRTKLLPQIVSKEPSKKTSSNQKLDMVGE